MEMKKNVNLPLALPAGTVLAGKYVIIQALGQGGFGITYMAEDHKTKEKVAIKEFFPDTMVTRGSNNAITIHSGSAGENFAYGKECFLEEAKTLAEFIGNENIVRVISYFEENGTAYFAMEYIEGESFKDYIESHGGKISWEDATRFLLPVMDALAVVHSKGIIHRDVTPDNIYVSKEGVVKLLDFGAARYSLGDKSRSLDVVLKHGFAPKEQYTRHGKQGPFTDVYTIGASFYYALTGKRPPDAIDRMEEDDLIPPTSLGVAILPDAEDAILKALNVQSAERFQDMIAFKNALTSVKGHTQSEPDVQEAQKPDPVKQTVEQNNPEIPDKKQQPGKKMYFIIGCATSVSVALLGTIIALLVSNNKNAEPAIMLSDDQGNTSSGVFDQPVKPSGNVIIGGNAPAAAVAEENSGENTKMMEETTGGGAEETEPEESVEDNTYSFERLGYDYENEMEWDSHLYFIFDASYMTWEEALEEAESYGGYLARINSEKEMKYILDLLEDYNDVYSYIYVGGARDSQSSIRRVKESYCWVDYDLGFMEKQYISGQEADDNYKWIDIYWMDGEPSFKDDAGEEQVLEFIRARGGWWLNDVSKEFPYLDYLNEGVQKKIGYLIEYAE